MDATDDMRSPFERAPTIANLASPPRAVPLNVRLRLLMGGLFSLIGWGWVLISLVFVGIFLSTADLDSLRFRSGAVGVAAGDVTQVERTSGRSGSRFIYANHYRFNIAETAYQGVSYSTGELLAPGQTVQVEYLADTPTLSRIQGMRGNLFDISILFILLIPLLGLALVVVGVVLGMRTMRLLTRGLASTGRVTGRSPTSARINGRPLYRIAYEFADGSGTLRQGATRSANPDNWQDGQPVAVICDPSHPARSRLLNNLPGKIGFDDFGNVRDPGPGFAAIGVGLPLITIVAYLLVLGLILAR